MKEIFEKDNPWAHLDLNNSFFLKEDWDILSKRKSGATLWLHSSLPEPFSGNPDSNVICLNANPGVADRLYEKMFGFVEYMRLTKETLEGKAKQSLWYDLKDHSGYCWLRNITKELRRDLNRNPNLFMIDYFPYHSPNTFDFPVELPSYEFTDKLVKSAIDENKIIIILRQKEKWLKRIAKITGYCDGKIVEKFNIILIGSNQNICLSKRNLGEDNYKKVLSVLQRQKD